MHETSNRSSFGAPRCGHQEFRAASDANRIPTGRRERDMIKAEIIKEMLYSLNIRLNLVKL